MPGKPVADNLGLVCLNDRLLQGIATCHFGPLGFPIDYKYCGPISLSPMQLWPYIPQTPDDSGNYPPGTLSNPKSQAPIPKVAERLHTEGRWLSS